MGIVPCHSLLPGQARPEAPVLIGGFGFPPGCFGVLLSLLDGIAGAWY